MRLPSEHAHKLAREQGRRQRYAKPDPRGRHAAPSRESTSCAKAPPTVTAASTRKATAGDHAPAYVDVVLFDGALQQLLDEFVAGGYAGLQAGLHSVAGPGYWGQALAQHHRSGRSKQWFGLVATVLERDVLLEHGLDESFLSGEDIDLRWRLERAGAKIGVSKSTIVRHRFDDTWEFALGQWLADGHGLGRMLGVHGLRSLVLLGLPLAAAARGCWLSVIRLQPWWIPYYLCFCAFNYVGMGRELWQRFGRRRRIAAAGMPA